MKPNQKLFDIQEDIVMFFDASVEIEERVCCSDIEMIGRDNETMIMMRMMMETGAKCCQNWFTTNWYV